MLAAKSTGLWPLDKDASEQLLHGLTADETLLERGNSGNSASGSG